MIQEGDYRTRDLVCRICDICGEKSIVIYGSIKYSTLKNTIGKDVCKKCFYLFRKTNNKIGKDSASWKGGVSLNKTSGYLRINKTNKYLHKKIMGDFLGRELSNIEQVHHIDMNKTNNEIDNLFLCNSIYDHHKIHSQMEDLGFYLFNKYIWYDYFSKIYVLDKKDCTINFEYKIDNNYINSLKIACKCKCGTNKEYAYVYLGKRKHVFLHRLIAEHMAGRKLNKKEHVHHIDGDTLNNSVNNLDIINISKHKKAHVSMQYCVAELYKNKIVNFDREKGLYYV